MGRERGATPDFVGREAELAELAAGLDDAVAGRGRVFLVHGEGGIGKTTLTRQLCGLAGERGVGVISAQCWEAVSAPVFWPWAQVLRPLAADSEVFGALDAAARDRVAGLLEGLGDSELEEGVARVMLFDSVVQLLRAAGERSPRLVVIEDLHEADAASLQLLQFAALSLRDVSCLVAGTFRDAEMRRRAVAAAILDRMAGQATSIALTGLSARHLAQLLGEDDAGLGERLEVLTGGNPLFAIELLRLLQRENRVHELAGDEPPPVPPTVRATLARRMENLTEPARTGLEVLSVAGAQIDRRLARELLGEDTVEALLEEAGPEHLIEATGDGAVLRFGHALVQAAVQDALPPTRRAALHLRVAEAIEVAYSGDLDAHLAALSHHFSRAGGTAAAERAHAYALAAGARARRLYAYEDAVRQYELALSLTRTLRSSDRDRAEILTSLGEAQILAGHVELGRETLLEAWLVADRIAVPGLRPRIAAGYSRPPMEGGIVNEAVVRLIEAALPEADSRLRPRLRARLAGELLFSDQSARREQLANEAVEEARAGDDRRTLMFALRAAASAIMRPENTEKSLGMLDEVAELARELADVDSRLQAVALRTPLQLELGRSRDLRESVAELVGGPNLVPVPMYRWFAGVHDAREALMRGDLEAAEALIQGQVEHAADVPNALAGWLNQMLYLNWELGRLHELEQLMDSIVVQRPGLYETVRAWRPIAKAERGALAEALEELRSIVADLPERFAGPRYFLLLNMNWVAEAAVVLADPDCARRVYATLEPWADRHHHAPVMTAVTYWGSVRRHLGNLAGILGDSGSAIAHHRAALAAHLRMQAAPYVVRSQFELARALGPTAEATELLAAARSGARQMGLVRLLERIEASPATSSAPGTAPASISARLEGEFWTFSAGGREVRLKDTKGLHYLLALVGRPGEPLHVLELQAAVEGTTRGARPGREDELVTESATGAPVLDATAREAYGRRAAELREEIEEAESFNDPERAGRARQELEFLEDELRAALGLGGRERKLGRSPAEQARINVTKAIRNSIRRLGEAEPELGRHLRACVRTGMLCVYADDIEPVRRWVVEGR